jgi:hypothetical protein
MPKKCIEVDCRNDGKYKMATIDNSVLYVCEEHMRSWMNGGCIPAEKTSKRILDLTMKYGIDSAFFIAGFSLILYMLATWMGQYGISPYTMEIWLGLALIIISWIISLVNTRKVASRARTMLS